MEPEDEKKCQLCPCCRTRTECTEFQKIVESKDAGVVIYRHSTRVDETIYMTNDLEAAAITTNDVFILRNTKDVEITSADIVPALVQNKVDCPRCQHIMDHAQRLLQNVSIIDKQDVIGICDHCKMKEKCRMCVDCAKILKKFITSEHIRGDYEETKERLKTWQNKIRTMLKEVSSDEKGTRLISRSQTDLRLDVLRHYSRGVVHVPDVEEMFGPGKHRPTSSNVEPVSKFVYFKDQDQASMTDIKSTKVEKTSEDDVIKVGKSHEERIQKTEDLESSSDQKLILDIKQKSITRVESAPKTRHVEQIETISSATVQKSKPHMKNLSAKESKINEIKPETKSRLTIKSTLKKTKPSESRLRTLKYHSEDDLPTIADIHIQESKVSKKGFKYFFPKQAKSVKRLPKSDLTSSVLIKATKDRLEDQAETKKEAHKRKTEEDEQKNIAKEEKKRAKKDKMDEEKSKILDGVGGKKLKTLDGEGGKNFQKLNDEGDKKLKKIQSEDHRGALEKKSKVFESKIQMKDSKTDNILVPLQKEVKKKDQDENKGKTQKQEISQNLLEEQNIATMDKAGQAESKKQNLIHKDINSKIEYKTKPDDDLFKNTVGPNVRAQKDIKNEPSEKKSDRLNKEKSDKKADQVSKEKGVKKSDQVTKGKDDKQKTEMDMLKKALESQKNKGQDGKDKPRQEKEEKPIQKKEEKTIQTKEETVEFQDRAEQDKGSPDAKNKLKKEKEEMTMLKKAHDRQTKEKEAKEKMIKAQEEAENKAKELAAKKSFAPPQAMDMSGITASSEPRTESEESALEKMPKQVVKEVDIKEVKVRKPSIDDLILRLVKLKKAAAAASKKHTQKGKRLSDLMLYSPRTVKHKRHNILKLDSCEICHDSELELDLESFLRKREKEEEDENAEIILGDKIIKKSHVPPVKKEKKKEPVLFLSTFDALTDKVRTGISRVVFEEVSPPLPTNPLKGGRYAQIDQESTKGIVRYALSDRTFIEKGWTMLPTEKVVRKMNVYRMRPVHPEFDWFEHNKNKRLIPYDNGEKFAEFDDNGRGRWYYRNGRLALDYYDAEAGEYTWGPLTGYVGIPRGPTYPVSGVSYIITEKTRTNSEFISEEISFSRPGTLTDLMNCKTLSAEINAQQRFVIYSSGEPDERGKSRPITVLATFDYLGNGVVFDHGGKIRLKYNQTEGVVLDRGIGPVSHWKWHTLNDPPVLQQVMIDTHMAHKDPTIIKLGGSADDKTRPDNEEMLAIEFDNFIKEKSKKSTQKFKPFQIKMKALKINEYFSLRVLDQATVYLIFRDGSTNLKLNIGMMLDHQEIVDTDTAEVGEVSNNVERCPARTDSLAALQRSVALAQRYERLRTARELRLCPPEPSASADQLTSAISRPLRPPLLTASSGSNLSAGCRCKSRKPSTNNLYYDTRLI